MRSGTYTHEHLAAYKSLEGYEFFSSGHVQLVYYRDISELQDVCYLKGKVVPSQRVTKKPYEAWICLETNGKVRCAHCTCMAGLGSVCVHVAAVLFKVEAAVKHGFTSVSTTSEACQWNKQFRKEVSMCSVSEMGSDLIRSNRKGTVTSVCSSSKDPLPETSTLTALKQCCPDAVFFTLIPKVDAEETDTADEDDNSSPIPLITSIGDEICSAAEGRSDDEAVKIYSEQCNPFKLQDLEIRTRDQSSSFLWHLHRKGRITGTSVHQVLHRRQDKSVDKLVCKIMGYTESDITYLKPIKWGTDNESAAFSKYAEQVKDKHINFSCRKVGLLIDGDNVFIGASADGLVECDCHGRGTLEIKCPYKHRDIHPLTAAHRDDDYCLATDGSLKVKHKYYSQVQLQMFVHKVDYCDFVIYTNVACHICRIVHDKEFTSQMIVNCKKFWFEYVLPEIRSHELAKDGSETAAGVITDQVCSCRKPAFGHMIRCSADECQTRLFHCSCVGLSHAPEGDWICKLCGLVTL